jgi:hypothetical protein
MTLLTLSQRRPDFIHCRIPRHRSTRREVENENEDKNEHDDEHEHEHE